MSDLVREVDTDGRDRDQLPHVMQTPYDRQNIQPFFDLVMDDLGHSGWRLRWLESDSYCWMDRKTIDICPMSSIEECKQMVLHEIAHIEQSPPHGNQHTVEFFARLRQLTKKFLGEDLSPYQQKFERWYVFNDFKED